MNFYYLGITLILVHEMDAMRCREWRIFPGLSSLKEGTGQLIFVMAHIPLLYWVLVEITNGENTFRFGFDLFLIFHFFLHLLFLLHPENEFRDWISWTIITAAGLCGLTDLLYT